jgi:hypothetical protein
VLALAGELAMRQECAERWKPVHESLSQQDLVQPQVSSAWQRMFTAQNDHAFITTMGFDVETFDHLIQAGFQRDLFHPPSTATQISV